MTFDQLTAREFDILGNLARGLSNASKLDVDSRPRAIVLARDGGLVK